MLTLPLCCRLSTGETACSPSPAVVKCTSMVRCMLKSDCSSTMWCTLMQRCAGDLARPIFDLIATTWDRVRFCDWFQGAMLLHSHGLPAALTSSLDHHHKPQVATSHGHLGAAAVQHHHRGVHQAPAGRHDRVPGQLHQGPGGRHGAGGPGQAARCHDRGSGAGALQLRGALLSVALPCHGAAHAAGVCTLP